MTKNCMDEQETHIFFSQRLCVRNSRIGERYGYCQDTVSEHHNQFLRTFKLLCLIDTVIVIHLFKKKRRLLRIFRALKGGFQKPRTFKYSCLVSRIARTLWKVTNTPR